MNKLNPESIEQLFSIIPNHPALSLMQFTDQIDDIAIALKEFSKKNDYELLLNISNNENLEKAKILEETPICKVKSIKWQQRRYASMGTLFYNVFVTTLVPNEHKEAFLENVLHHIKTAGHILFFLPKGNRDLLDTWWEMLEEKSLVSISTLDISEKYEILIGKKMHGWDSSFK
jgi:hypothetical protein